MMNDSFAWYCTFENLIILTTTFCFVVSLIVTWANMDDLVSYAEFSDKEEKRIQKKLDKKVNKQ